MAHGGGVVTVVAGEATNRVASLMSTLESYNHPVSLGIMIG